MPMIVHGGEESYTSIETLNTFVVQPYSTVRYLCRVQGTGWRVYCLPSFYANWFLKCLQPGPWFTRT
jgi:hypothetical protein